MIWWLIAWILPGSILSIGMMAMAASGAPWPHPLNRLRRERLPLLAALIPITAPLVGILSIVKVGLERLGQAWFDAFWKQETIVGRMLSRSEQKSALRGLSPESRRRIWQNAVQTQEIVAELEGEESP